MEASSSPFDSRLSLTREPLPPQQINMRKGRTNKWDPAPYERNPSRQEALNSISIRDPLRLELVNLNELKMNTTKTLEVSGELYELLKNPVRLAESYSDLINHHVATRVSLFFQQAIVCYNTPFHFEVGDTEGQIFEAKTLKVKTEDDPEIRISYQAAHSSTIPSLKACPIRDYQKAEAKGKAPKYFPFLGGSYMENLDNSTVGLPTFVNQIDTLIDGNSKSRDALRLDTIRLINKLAAGKITPCKATRKFLVCFLRQLEERPAASNTLTAAKRKTISIYKEKVKEMMELAETPDNLEQENEFFDGLLSSNFCQEKDEELPILRKIVYKRKFEIIREAQFVEAKIQKIVAKYFPKAVKPADKHAVALSLIFKAKNDPLLNKTLQVLFAVSLSALEKDKNLCRELQQKYEQNADRYEKALRDIRATVRSFQRMEKSFQAMLLRDFRVGLRGLTQKQLEQKIKKVIDKKIEKEEAKDTPNLRKIEELRRTPTSASTISRLENSRIHILKDFKTDESQRRKYLTLYQAKIISKVLNVDPGHFFCSFFSS